MRPYVIWSPPFDHRVGGIKALYALRDALGKRGFEVHMHEHLWLPSLPADAVVVYPEIVTDNPLGAERIVRWRLNKADVPDDGLVYDWAPTGDGSPLLTLDLIDHDELRRARVRRREWVACVVHKGVADPVLIPRHALRVTPQWPTQRDHTVRLLAGAEHVVSFDEFTMLNLEAVLLGTPVVLYPTGRWSWSELEAHDLIPPGVCSHPADIEAARVATGDAWPWYLDQVAEYPALLDRFIEDTQA